MQKELSVAIIILNWNRPQDTIKCIDSLKKIYYKNYKIILVDNGSTDESVKILSSKYPEISIIQNVINYGYAKEVNIGIKFALKSKPQYILLLNNDTNVNKDFLTHLVFAFSSNPKIGIVGPKIYFQNKPDTIWFNGGLIDFQRGPFLHMHQLEKDTLENSLEKKVDYINGCCMLFRSDILNNIDYFDEDYGSYVEDVDFNYRAKKMGYISHIVPQAKIWHKISASTGGDGNKKKEFLKAKNMLLFGFKILPETEKSQYFHNILKIKFREVLLFLSRLQIQIAINIGFGILSGVIWKLHQRSRSL